MTDLADTADRLQWAALKERVLCAPHGKKTQRQRDLRNFIRRRLKMEAKAAIKAMRKARG